MQAHRTKLNVIYGNIAAETIAGKKRES